MKELLKKWLPEGPKLRLRALDHYWRGERELRLLRYFCDPERMSIDVGANVGVYSYFMSGHSRGVVSYEPNPILAANLRRAMSGIDIRAVAVSNARGRTVLVIPVLNGKSRHELASIAQSFDGTATERFEVEVVTLDSEGLADVGFIKIDVEQNELKVLAGAMETIRRDRPIVMTECTPLLYPEPVPRMFSSILALGYQGYFRFHDRYHPFRSLDATIHAASEKYGSKDFMANNIVFLPEDSRHSARFLQAVALVNR